MADLLRKESSLWFNNKNGFDPIQKCKYPEFVADIISMIVSSTDQITFKLKNFCSGVLNDCSGAQSV